MNAILTVENVSKSYTGHKALDDVSIEVPRGAVYGLLGPNGAGKTTLIRVINRLTIADSGRVLLDGKAMSADDIFHIGYMPEERGRIPTFILPVFSPNSSSVSTTNCSLLNVFCPKLIVHTRQSTIAIKICFILLLGAFVVHILEAFATISGKVISFF